MSGSAVCWSTLRRTPANPFAAGSSTPPYRERRHEVHAVPDSAGQADTGAGLRPRRFAGRACSRPMASASISARGPLPSANELYPDLHFVLGDVEDPATLAPIEGPFDYIVIADTIGMFEDIDGTLRLVHHLCAPSTRIIISYYSHLWEPILKLGELLRLQEPATEDQLHRHRRLPQPDGSRRFRGDQPGAAAADAACAGSASDRSSTDSSRRCRASGSCACGPISSAARYGRFRIANFR